MKHQGVCIVGLVLCLSVAGCGGQLDSNRSDNAVEEHKAKLRAAYVSVAQEIADEHRKDPAAVPANVSPSQLMAEAKTLIADMRRVRDVDPDMQLICDEAAGATQDIIDSTDRLERLPRPPGEFEQFLTGFFYGYSFNFSGAADYSNTIRNQEAAIRSEVIKLGQSLDRAHGATILLPRVARKVSGPVTASAPVTVDFDETWGFRGPDWITLTNGSFRTLHNVTVVVELEGKPRGGREVHTNVHFIPEWSSGQSVYAKYDEGVQVEGRKIGCKTVINVQKVTLSVYADELTHEGYVYEYTQEENNKDIARYIDNSFKPRASYSPYYVGLGILAPDRPTIAMSFTGLQFVHDVSAKITFKKGYLESTRTSYRAQWEQSADWKVEFSDLTWDPTETDVELTFNQGNGGVVRTYHWDWKK